MRPGTDNTAINARPSGSHTLTAANFAHRRTMEAIDLTGAALETTPATKASGHEPVAVEKGRMSRVWAERWQSIAYNLALAKAATVAEVHSKWLSSKT